MIYHRNIKVLYLLYQSYLLRQGRWCQNWLNRQGRVTTVFYTSGDSSNWHTANVLLLTTILQYYKKERSQRLKDEQSESSMTCIVSSHLTLVQNKTVTFWLAAIYILFSQVLMTALECGGRGTTLLHSSKKARCFQQHYRYKLLECVIVVSISFHILSFIFFFRSTWLKLDGLASSLH